MLPFFGALKQITKIQSNSHCIDNWVFQLHYRATTIIFLVATLLVSSQQYFGEKIRCINDYGSGKFDKVIETYCFFTGTFTVVKEHNVDRHEGLYNAGPGIGPYGLGSKEEITRHFYYQWVPFVLFGQAFFFHFIHILWKQMEGGRIRLLTTGLNNASYSLLDKVVQVGSHTIPSAEDREKSLHNLRKVLLERLVINRNWGRLLCSCEILNAGNVALQIYIIHVFLGGQFFTFGSSVCRDGSSVLDAVFPKKTKCIFYTYGPSGSLQTHDALCIMALNIVNEKIYLFLWFWLFFLLIVSCLGVVWRFLSIFLHYKSRRFNKMIFDNLIPGKIDLWNFSVIMKNCTFTDWLFIKYLAKNMDGMVFRDLFLGLVDDLQETKALLRYGWK